MLELDNYIFGNVDLYFQNPPFANSAKSINKVNVHQNLICKHTCKLVSMLNIETLI